MPGAGSEDLCVGPELVLLLFWAPLLPAGTRAASGGGTEVPCSLPGTWATTFSQGPSPWRRLGFISPALLPSPCHVSLMASFSLPGSVNAICELGSLVYCLPLGSLVKVLNKTGSSTNPSSDLTFYIGPFQGVYLSLFFVSCF